MEITKKIFWKEAVKGGTIIGLVSVAFSLLKYSIGLTEVKFWGGFVSFFSFLVFITLIYLYTKKISDSADASVGFSYGRSIGFIVSMMLFVGFIQGIYSAVMNNFVNPEMVREAIDTTMLLMQDMVSDSQFDETYDIMRKAMFNPGYLVFSQIFGYVLYGSIIGLVVSAFTKREPDILAPDPEDEQE